MWPSTPANGLRVPILGSPILLPVSTQPNNFTLTFQADQPWILNIYSINGTMLFNGVTFPDGTSPLKLTLQTNNLITYPTTIGLDIIDAQSLIVMNHVRQQLYGGDVLKIHVVYPLDMPVAKGYYMVNVTGRHMLVNLQSLPQLMFNFGEVEVYGPDGGGGGGSTSNP